MHINSFDHSPNNNPLGSKSNERGNIVECHLYWTKAALLYSRMYDDNMGAGCYKLCYNISDGARCIPFYPEKGF